MQWQEFRSHIRHLSTSDLARIEKAFILGKKMHEGQLRKSGEPYFIHPITVALMLVDMHGDCDTIIAALLHDTVEDTPLTLREIDEQFHGTVATLIDGLTKLSSADIATNPKLDEQIESMRKIFTLMEQDVRIMVIKLVDRLHNMQTIEFLAPAKQTSLARETLDVYVKIADKLCMQDMRDELQALCLSTLEPDLSAELMTLRMKNEERGLSVIDSMKSTLRSHDPVLISHMSLSYESKTWDQLRTQYTEGSTIRTGQSFITIAFICDDIDTCYRTLGALHQHWKREVLSFQDFINAPQLNGYRGLHTTLITEDGTRIRCKIRTCEMHTYARYGIVMKCFDAKFAGAQDYVPWTKRITPLTMDTEGSSTDFWQSLQSDILGETITIHGPGDTTVQLPKGATALDGAFYLLKKNALRIQTIKKNGHTVRFDTTLENADSLDLTLADHETYSHDWFQSLHTTYSQAILRSAIATLPLEERATIGRKELQKVFKARQQGFIEEFSERSLSAKAKELGYASIDEIVIAIGDGRKTAEEMYELLYEKSHIAPHTSRATYSIRYDTESSELFSYLHSLLLEYGVIVKNIDYRRMDKKMRCILSVDIFEDSIPELIRTLQSAGAINISVQEKSWKHLTLLITIVSLWGIHPVLARWFLLHGVPPITLLTFRLGVFSVCSIILFFVWKIFSKQRYAPIPRIVRLAILPAVSTVALATVMYEALLVVPSALHLGIMRFNILLIPWIATLRSKSPSCSRLGILLCAVGGIVFSIFQPPITMTIGILLSIGTMAIYGTYSQVISSTLLDNKIGLRYPYLLFVTGLLLSVVTLILAPYAHFANLHVGMILALICFMIICVFIPHACYYALLHKRPRHYAADPFFLEAPIAMVGEFLLLGTLLLPSAYFAICVSLLALFIIQWRKNTHSIL